MKKATVVFASLALGLALIGGCTNDKDANPGAMSDCTSCETGGACPEGKTGQCPDAAKHANPGVVEGAAKGDCCDEGAKKAHCGSACPEGNTGACPEAAKKAQECPHGGN